MPIRGRGDEGYRHQRIDELHIIWDILLLNQVGRTARSPRRTELKSELVEVTPS